MSARVLLILFFLVILLDSCKKETQPVSIQKQIDASQITMTDDMGNFTGSIDHSDWAFDAHWSPAEFNLFNFTDSLNNDSVFEADTITSLGIPNPIPAGTDLYYYLRVNKSTKLKVVLADEYLNTIVHSVLKIQGSDYGKVVLGVATDPLQKNQYYRLYYAFINSSGQLYKKGHGDIFVSP